MDSTTYRVHLLFHMADLSTETLSTYRDFFKPIDTSSAMLACCNWQHIHFCQIEGAGSIPVANTAASSFLS